MPEVQGVRWARGVCWLSTTEEIAMKMRQAAKIVENLAAERPLRYREDTIQRAHRTWNHHEDRHTRRFFAGIKRLLGPWGFFDWQMDAAVSSLELNRRASD